MASLRRSAQVGEAVLTLQGKGSRHPFAYPNRTTTRTDGHTNHSAPSTSALPRSLVPPRARHRSAGNSTRHHLASTPTRPISCRGQTPTATLHQPAGNTTQTDTPPPDPVIEGLPLSRATPTHLASIPTRQHSDHPRPRSTVRANPPRRYSLHSVTGNPLPLL